MTSTFIPVETILKVDDDEVLVEQTSGDRSQKVSERPVSFVSTNYISIGTQCPPLESERKSETTEANVLPGIERNENKSNTLIRETDSMDGVSVEEAPLLMKTWPTQQDPNTCHEDKLFIPATFPQQIACNFQAFPVDEKFFLQFDYKTRNKLKTKQRRLDPFYRSQERIRQRTVMRLKRQDPRFRAVEREKGRYRMRLKRLDPIFRSQERERQRERMKVKRRDPDFREREREQQKSRLHVKRLDPTFKEKERAQDRLRMRIKRQNNGLYSAAHSEKNKLNIGADCIITESQAYFKDVDEPFSSQTEIRSGEQSGEVIVPENVNNTRLLTLKPREASVESFHYRKAHILNFNFYNSGKEQWANHSELYTKGIAHFNILREDGKLQPSASNLVHESHILMGKDDLVVPRKSAFKPDSLSQALMKIKDETPTPNMPQDAEKRSTTLTNHDISCVTSKLNSSIHRHPLPPVSGNPLC